MMLGMCGSGDAGQTVRIPMYHATSNQVTVVALGDSLGF